MKLSTVLVICLLAVTNVAYAQYDKTTPWEAGVAWVDPGGTVLDNYDGVIPWSRVVIVQAVDVMRLGSYIVRYSVKDSSGNEGTAARLVNITDTKPPIITLKGMNPVNIVLGAPLSSIDLSATATDSFCGVVIPVMTGTVDITKAGTYTLTYTASDTSGNVVVAMRTVVVTAPVDTTKPVITLKQP